MRGGGTKWRCLDVESNIEIIIEESGPSLVMCDSHEQSGAYTHGISSQDPCLRRRRLAASTNPDDLGGFRRWDMAHK